MARAVFYSFHFDRDFWRVQQIRNIGALEGQEVLPAQKWEQVKQQGRAAIEAWIAKEMRYKSAVVVLVGAQTAARPWVKYEIEKAWADKRPLVGIRVHGLADSNQHTDTSGANPFAQLKDGRGTPLSTWVPLYDPVGPTSQQRYNDIKANLTNWVGSAYKRP